MSTESYKGFKFRHCRDRESPGKIRTYVEKGVTFHTQHIYKGSGGSPPYICYKTRQKPSSLSEAKKLAYKWANKYGR